MFGWFRKKPAPPIRDLRNWNEDWRVGDTAECVVDRWHECVKPWERPARGQQFTVTGFSEGVNPDANARAYFLHLKGWPYGLTTTSFRKVRPVSAEQSEVVSRILNAKPGADNPREDA